MEVKVTYDKAPDAAYIHLVPIGPGEAFRQVIVDDADVTGYPGDIILDFDRERHLVGIEVLSASKVLPRAVVAAAEPPGSS